MVCFTCGQPASLQCRHCDLNFCKLHVAPYPNATYFACHLCVAAEQNRLDALKREAEDRQRLYETRLAEQDRQRHWCDVGNHAVQAEAHRCAQCSKYFCSEHGSYKIVGAKRHWSAVSDVGGEVAKAWVEYEN